MLELEKWERVGKVELMNRTDETKV